jgi:hypothetical protein
MTEKKSKGQGRTALIVAIVAIGLYVATIVLNG